MERVPIIQSTNLQEEERSKKKSHHAQAMALEEFTG